jgi:hypothetical protein
MYRLQRTFLAAEGRNVDMPLLVGSTTRCRCASQDRIAEGLLLGVRIRPSLKVRDPFMYKRA